MREAPKAQYICKSTVATSNSNSAAAAVSGAGARDLAAPNPVPTASHTESDLAFDNNSTDLVRPPLPTLLSFCQNDTLIDKHVRLDHFVETQHSLGFISVLLWSRIVSSNSLSSYSTPRLASEFSLTGTFKLDERDNEGSRTLILSFVQRDTAAGVSTGSSGSSSEGVEHVRRFKVPLPALAKSGQSGEFGLAQLANHGGALGPLTQIKLELSNSEKQTALRFSRSGYADEESTSNFPLSAKYLAEGRPRGLVCSVCRHGGDIVIPFRSETRFRALPSQGWEELVDAWMCHADQHLNRTLTETAVRFTHKMAGTTSASDSVSVPQDDQAGDTLWVGDTYFLVSSTSLNSSAVTIEQVTSTNSVSLRRRLFALVVLSAGYASPLGPAKKVAYRPFGKVHIPGQEVSSREASLRRLIHRVLH